MRLIAEANEFSARQLAEMKRIGEWLHATSSPKPGAWRNSTRNCGRERRRCLRQKSFTVKALNSSAKLMSKHKRTSALRRSAARKAAAEKAEQRAREEIKSNEQAAPRRASEQERAKALLLESQADREKAEAVRNDAERRLQGHSAS